MAIRFLRLQKNMRLKGFRLDSLPAIIIGASIALNVLLWIVVLATFPKDSPSAILHYTAGVGIDFIGEGWQIIMLPSMGILLIAVNVLLARFVERASKIAFWICISSLPLLQVLLLGTYGILLRLNS